MSGMTGIRRSARTASASGVIGPLAPSTISFVLRRGAFSPVICPSKALGSRTSHGSSKRSALVTRRLPEQPGTLTLAGVQLFGGVDPAAAVAYRDDPAAQLVQECGRDRADVPITLHDHRGVR